MPTPIFARNSSSRLLLILLAGLAVRVLYLLELPVNPDYASPAIDAAFNDRWAYALAGGTAAESVPEPFAGRPYFRPPGYPFFLAGVYRCCGADCFPPRAAQMLLGLANTLLVYALARRVCAPVFAALASLAAATYWVFVYYEGELLEPALLIFLTLAALNLLARQAAGPRPGELFIGGLLLGLGALVRPNVFLVGICLPVWLAAVWIRARRAGAEPHPALPHQPAWRQMPGLGAAMACLLAGLCLPVAATLARNLAVSGEFVPISANAGINLYIGNHAHADGTFVMPAELGEFADCNDYPEIVRGLERAAGRRVGYAEASRIFTRRAWQFAREHPSRFMMLTLRKAALFWAPLEIPHNKVEQSARRHSTVLRRLPLTFAMIFSLAAAGGIGAILWRRRAAAGQPAAWPRRAAIWLLALFILVYYVSFWPFFIVGQYRAPAIPLLIILAAAALESFYAAAARRAWRRVGLMAIIWLAVWAAVSRDFSGVDWTIAESRWHFDRGAACERRGDWACAAEEYMAALQVYAGHEKARLNLANILLEQNQSGQAEAHYREIIRRNPRAAAAYNNLGRALAAAGRRAEAREAYSRALKIAPDEPLFIANMSEFMAQEQERATSARSERNPGKDGVP